MTMAGVSFSVNGLNELEILLSLRASKLIQSGQISVCAVSVRTFAPHPLWRSCRTLESTDWLLLCNSEINKRVLLYLTDVTGNARDTTTGS